MRKRRYVKQRRASRFIAKSLIACMAFSIAIPLVARPEPDAMAIEAAEPDDESAIEVVVWVKFADESEQFPYSGHGITLDDIQDVPEWSIPDEYAATGGCFPKSCQTYLYNLCEDAGISYTMMLALIETESGYRWDAISEDGNCKGYTMIYESLHTDRMAELGVTDIMNPYGNMAVAIDIMKELSDRYENEEQALMAYNCGETGAARLWEQGIYSTSYTEKILERKGEIYAEIYGY